MSSTRSFLSSPSQATEHRKNSPALAKIMQFTGAVWSVIMGLTTQDLVLAPLPKRQDHSYDFGTMMFSEVIPHEGATSSRPSISSSVSYSNVRLNEYRNIDLYVHHSSGKFAGLWGQDRPWLQDGRPRDLSDVSLATWSLLTTSIKEYQTGMRRYTTKIYLRMILPVYLIWVVSLFFVSLEGVHQSEEVFIVAYYFIFVAIVVFAAMVAAHYKQKHVDEVFNPAVQTVIEELQDKLNECGYEVVFMVETGSWCQKASLGFLRFTPLPNEERRVAEQS